MFQYIMSLGTGGMGTIFAREQRIFNRYMATFVKRAGRTRNNCSEPVTDNRLIQLKPLPFKQGSKRTGALAFKRGMMGHFDEWGQRHPLSDCQALRSFVVGAALIQEVGIGPKSAKKLHQAQAHTFSALGVSPKLRTRGFRVTSDALLPPGTRILATHFVPGQFVDIQAISIGKGFQGPMKRWGFKGLPATHGVSLAHRAHGATGCRTDPGKVDKGKKMAGHMGNRMATVQRLQILKIDTLLNCLYVRGSVPGPDNQVVRIIDTLRLRKGESSTLIQTLPFPTYIASETALPRELLIPKPPADPLHVEMAKSN